VIVLDERGTGLSDRSLGFGSLEDRTEDVRAVLDAVGSEQLMHCDRDPILPVGAGRELAKQIPGARCVEIDGDVHGSWRREEMDKLRTPLIGFTLEVFGESQSTFSCVIRTRFEPGFVDVQRPRFEAICKRLGTDAAQVAVTSDSIVKEPSPKKECRTRLSRTDPDRRLRRLGLATAPSGPCPMDCAEAGSARIRRIRAP